MSDEQSGFDLDGVFDLLTPVATFVTPYVDAVVEATPEARVHLIASARELCLAVEGFLGALEDAARSAVNAKDGDDGSVGASPDIAVVSEPEVPQAHSA